jgi:hypothetical protein
MIWKNFERKRSWPNLATISEFVYREREDNHENPVSVAGVQPEIWTERLPYKSLEHCPYANLPS